MSRLASWTSRPRASARPDDSEDEGDANEGFGITLGNLTAERARRIGVPSGTTGALITDVDPSGSAARSGVRPGDVILQVNRKPVDERGGRGQGAAGRAHRRDGVPAGLAIRTRRSSFPCGRAPSSHRGTGRKARRRRAGGCVASFRVQARRDPGALAAALRQPSHRPGARVASNQRVSSIAILIASVGLLELHTARMTLALEREVKLRFDSVDEARTAIAGSDATPIRSRRLQEDYLLDDPNETLRNRRCVLRVRIEAGKNLLTFKGPVQPSHMKVREELETVVGDGETMIRCFEHLGYRVWFRYHEVPGGVRARGTRRSPSTRLRSACSWRWKARSAA